MAGGDKRGLEGQRVNIFLKTPLFRFKYVLGGQERELLDNAVRLSGDVIKESEAGLFVKVDVLSNMKTKETELPFEKIFLPFEKIDFVIVDE